MTAAVLLLLAGGVAAVFAGRSGARFMLYLEQPTPALSRLAPALDPVSPPPPRLSPRVIVVIVDGLRLDASRGLPFLDRLRAAGVDAEAASQYPTYSKPNYVNILTGVPPTASGIRTNRFPGYVKLDTLMDRARDAGLRSGFASDNDPMPRLFLRPRERAAEPEIEDVNAIEEGTVEAAREALMAELRGDFDDARYAPWPGGFRDSAETVLAAKSEDALVVLHLALVDVAGHEHGADSDEYRDAAVLTDLILERVLGPVDLTTSTIVLVADHGHTDSGGHGGLEPEVVRVPLIVAGAGVVPGAQVAGAQLQDVAPTVARLLGVSPPGHALGRSLVELLALDDPTRARFVAADHARAARNASAVAASVYGARRDRLERRALRLVFLIVGTAIALVTAWWLRLRGGIRLYWQSLVVGVPAFFFVYYTLLGTIGQRFSPSLLPAQGHIATELVKYGAAATAVQIAAGWWALRRKLDLADRLATANGIALVGLLIAMTPVALIWTLFPAPYVEVPGPRMLVLIPAVQVSVACYAIGVALTLAVEVVVFFSRAVDPRVRTLQLEKALARARVLAELAERGELPPPRRRRRRKPRTGAPPPAPPGDPS